MIQFYYSTEGMLLRERIADIAMADRFDLAEEGHQTAFESALKSVGLFGGARTLVVREPFAAGRNVLELLEQCDAAKDKERTVVLIEEGAEKTIKEKSETLWVFLEKNAKVQELKPLVGKALNDWIAAKAANAGCRIDAAAIVKLITYTSIPIDRRGKEMRADLWRLQLEIKKLAAHSYSRENYGHGVSIILEKEVELLVAPPASLNVFDLTDALAAKDRASAVTALARHLREGNDPFHLHGMFVYQFRNLLRVKSLLGPPASPRLQRSERATPAGVAREAHLHPYVISKLFTAARKFELDELKRDFLRLVQLERDAKNGIIDMTDGLYQFVFTLHS